MWKKKTKNGKIAYCERYTDYMTGKSRDVSVTYDKDTTRNQKEAAAILKQRIDELTAPRNKEYTLEQVIEEYRKDQKITVKKSTYERNYFAAEAIMKILRKDILVSRLTAKYIRDNFKRSGKANSTLNEHLKRLSAILRWAYEEDLIEDINFINKVKRFKDKPHKQKIQDKYLESDELKLLLSKLKNPVWKLLAEFLALSGLRYGEAAALLKSDIDLDNKVIHISKTFDSVNRVTTSAKTNSSIDDVSIQPQLEDCIKRISAFMARQALINGYRTKLFLSDKRGKNIHYYSFNKYFRENSEAVIGKRLTTHSLRHTHASLLFEQGFTLDEVSRRLRHADSKVTREIYIHVTKKLKKKDAEKLKNVVLF